MTTVRNEESGEQNTLGGTIWIGASGGPSLTIGNLVPILFKGTLLPAEATHEFLNATDKEWFAGMLPITLYLYYGDHDNRDDNNFLGTFTIEGVQAAPDGPQKFSVIVHVNTEQLLSVAYNDPVRHRYRKIGFIDISTLEPSDHKITPETIINNNKFLIESANLFMKSVVESVQEIKPLKFIFPSPGEDTSQNLQVSFYEALAGAEKDVTIIHTETCPICVGSGVQPGKMLENCPECQGSGWKTNLLQTDDGPISIPVTGCPACNSQGTINLYPCLNCQGKTWISTTQTKSFALIPGIESGAEVIFLFQGDRGHNGGPPGHHRIRVIVTSHPLFNRAGEKIFIRVPVSGKLAKEGGQLLVPGLEKGTSFSIELLPHTQNGKRLLAGNWKNFTITAIIQIYHPILLFTNPDIRQRIQSIKDALDGREYESPTRQIKQKAE